MVAVHSTTKRASPTVYKLFAAGIYISFREDDIGTNYDISTAAVTYCWILPGLRRGPLYTIRRRYGLRERRRHCLSFRVRLSALGFSFFEREN